MITANRPVANHTIEITRVFDAPRELVWRAWTDPQQVKEIRFSLQPRYS